MRAAFSRTSSTTRPQIPPPSKQKEGAFTIGNTLDNSLKPSDLADTSRSLTHDSTMPQLLGLSHIEASIRNNSIKTDFLAVLERESVKKAATDKPIEKSIGMPYEICHPPYNCKCTTQDSTLKPNSRLS